MSRSKPSSSDLATRLAPIETTAPLRSEPHATRWPNKARLQAAIGREIRSHRKRHGLTVNDLASSAEISPSMLSKIENGSISANLAKLQSLSRSLGLPLSSLIQRCEDNKSPVFTKACEGVPIERRGSQVGYLYQVLCGIGASLGEVSVQPLLITATEQDLPLPLRRENGTTFVYMLEGSMIYSHGSRLYRLSPGDSLLLDADCLHGPVSLLDRVAQYLSIHSARDHSGNAL